MMSRNDYLNEAFKLFNEGKISDSAYDAILAHLSTLEGKIGGVAWNGICG